MYIQRIGLLRKIAEKCKRSIIKRQQRKENSPGVKINKYFTEFQGKLETPPFRYFLKPFLNVKDK